MISGGVGNPQHSTGALNLPVAFIIASSAILMHTASVSHLVLMAPVGAGNMNVSGPYGGIFYDPWIYPHIAKNLIGPLSLGFS